MRTSVSTGGYPGRLTLYSKPSEGVDAKDFQAYLYEGLQRVNTENRVQVRPAQLDFSQDMGQELFRYDAEAKVVRINRQLIIRAPRYNPAKRSCVLFLSLITDVLRHGFAHGQRTDEHIQGTGIGRVSYVHFSKPQTKAELARLLSAFEPQAFDRFTVIPSAEYLKQLQQLLYHECCSELGIEHEERANFSSEKARRESAPPLGLAYRGLLTVEEAGLLADILFRKVLKEFAHGEDSAVIDAFSSETVVKAKEHLAGQHLKLGSFGAIELGKEGARLKVYFIPTSGHSFTNALIKTNNLYILAKRQTDVGPTLLEHIMTYLLVARHLRAVDQGLSEWRLYYLALGFTGGLEARYSESTHPTLVFALQDLERTRFVPQEEMITLTSEQKIFLCSLPVVFALNTPEKIIVTADLNQITHAYNGQTRYVHWSVLDTIEKLNILKDGDEKTETLKTYVNFLRGFFEYLNQISFRAKSIEEARQKSINYLSFHADILTATNAVLTQPHIYGELAVDKQVRQGYVEVVEQTLATER